MPTYLYETIPQNASDKPVQFEVQQRMTEKPLETHPETGVPVQRIITGGLMIPPKKAGGGNVSDLSGDDGDSCVPSCGCC